MQNRSTFEDTSSTRPGMTESHAPLRSRRSDAIKFTQRLTHFLLGNVLTQALAAVTGLFLVRWLTVEQYAIYTVGTVAAGAVTVLSKAGTNVGFVSMVGRYWPDFERISPLIAALRQARRTMFVYLVPFVLILAGYLLHQTSAGLVSSSIILGLLVIFWIGEMNSKTVDQILYFANQTTRVQYLDSALSIARFLLTGLLFISGALSAVTALLISSLMAVARIFPIDAWVYKIVPRPMGIPKANELQEIMDGVRRQLPTSAFYVMQGQIVLLLLSRHADTATIAGYGAMLRIIALLAPVRTLNAAFCIPLAAKAKKNVGPTILLLAAANALPCGMLIAIGLLFPQAVLWLIGPQYGHLHDEMLVMIFSTAFIITGGSFWNLVAHRGWVKRSILQIPLGVIWVLIAGYIVDLSTISGALILNAGFTGPSVIIGVVEMWLNRQQRSTSASSK